MRSVSVRLADLDRCVIPIGFVDENLHTQVRFDCKKMFDEYPAALPSLAVSPPEGSTYPAIVTKDGDYVVWDVTASDCASDGNGEIQLTFVVGEIVAKSYVGRIRVTRSLNPSGEIPDPVQDWITQANEVLGEVEDALTDIPETIDTALAEAKASGEFDGPKGDTGSPGDPTQLIDDVTPAANKTFSSSKIDSELSDVKSAIQAKVDEPSTEGTDGQVLATDGEGGRYWKTVSGGGGGGTSDYSDLTNKPQINSVTLSGNKSLSDLGIASATDLAAKYTKPQTGIPSSDLSSDVQTSLGKADTALQGQDVTDAVDAYLEENFTNPSNPPLDRSLTSELSAAPADMVGELKSAFDFEQIQRELTIIPNEYVDSNGAFQPYNNWSRTDYVEVTPGQDITIISTEKSEYNFSYDANKNPVGSKWAATSGTMVKTIGSNIKYIVLSGKTAAMQSVVLFAGDKKISLASSIPLSQTMGNEVDDKIKSATQLDTIVSPTAYLMKQQIPNYYFSRNETAQSKSDIGYLDAKINSIPSGYHFLFVTDTHWNDNAMQSAKLMSYVRDRIGAKIVLFGGDILTAYRTEAIAYRWLCDFTFEFKNVFGSNFLPVVGNHDLNAAFPTDPTLLYSDLVPVFTQGCDKRFHYCDYYDDRIDSMQASKSMTDDEVARLKQYFRTCYYVDDVDGKVRYIVYNTGAGDGGSGISQYIDSYITGTYEELLVIEWVYNTLMNTPTGYHIILCTHVPGDFSWSSPNQSILSATRQRFAAVVAGMKARKRVSAFLPTSLSDYSWWGGTRELYFDYRNAPEVGIVAVIGGHTHVDTFGLYGFSATDYDSSHIISRQLEINGLSATCHQSSTSYETGVKYISEVPIILTQHDAYINNSGPNSHEMELGTVTEQVFDVVTITPDSNIALTRFGAGNDRYLTIE